MTERRRRGLRGLVALGLALSGASVSAHTMDSAHWQWVQLDDHHWDSRLRLPARADGGLAPLTPVWPTRCRRLGEPVSQPAEDSVVVHWRLRCSEGLVGGIGLSGFALTLPDAVLQVVPLRDEPIHVVLSRERSHWAPDQAVPPPVAHYLALGVHHILLGPDHLLFVLGLWALWRRSGAGWRRLVTTITAFTAAHSITLAGAALGGWSLPGGAVEASIAASILLLAVELARPQAGAAQRWPAGIAFAFGLLHGFGFAGALAATGLPDGARVWALAAFNLGIEAGQLAFVLMLTVLAHRLAAPAVRWAPVMLSAYGGIAAAWLLDRSVAVLYG